MACIRASAGRRGCESAAATEQRMRTLSWHDFDQAVAAIADRIRGQSFSGIHGIPRGGLVLAVSLSHRLELPLLNTAEPGCLLVDDVYESGRTLEPYRELEACTTLVWISKQEPLWWQAVEVTASSEWIVFPWENATVAAADEADYRQSRR
jgi:xanthine phosphoribosyltransferase